MKEKYNSVIRTYFSNYVTWLLIVTLLFIVSVVTAIAIRGFHNQILLYIVAFLIIYSLSTPLLMLYFKARKDIKTGNIETISIKISEIRYDNRLNFENKSGATVGKTKYQIVDDNQNIYLVSTANDKDSFMMFQPQPTFSVELVYLAKSRLVISMRIIENFKTVREVQKQRHNIMRFKKVFRHYF